MHYVSTLTLLASTAVVGAHAVSSIPAHAQDALVGKSATTSAADANTYYAITPDVRRCAFPRCGGWFVKELNSAMTTCHDGRTAEQCYTPVIDWSASGIPEPQQTELLDAARASLASRQVRAIVQGTLASSDEPRSELGKLIVTDAWIAEGDGAASGSFVHVEDNGLRCFAPPCPNLTERTVNTSEVTDIADIDFAPARLSDDELAECTEQMYTGDGILVAGHRFVVQANGSTEDGRTATQVYRHLGTGTPGTQ